MHKTADWEEWVTVKMKNNLDCKIAHIFEKVKNLCGVKWKVWRENENEVSDWGETWNHLQWGSEISSDPQRFATP